MSQTSLEKLKAQKKQLEFRIRQAEQQAKKSERKKELQRKILVGSYYLEQARVNNEWGQLKQVMDGYLTREIDRKLFELGIEAVTKSTELDEPEYAPESNLELQPVLQTEE